MYRRPTVTELKDQRIAELERERDELRKWKEEAMPLLPLQEWGQELKLPLGASIHAAILPALKRIAELEAKIEALENLTGQMTAEEAQVCYNAAEPIPISEERIKEIVAFATRPTKREAELEAEVARWKQMAAGDRQVGAVGVTPINLGGGLM